MRLPRGSLDGLFATVVTVGLRDWQWNRVPGPPQAAFAYGDRLPGRCRRIEACVCGHFGRWLGFVL